MPDSHQVRWIKPKSLAARLEIHRATLWRWVRDGRFPPPTEFSPRCWRWRTDEVERWEAGHTPTGSRRQP